MSAVRGWLASCSRALLFGILLAVVMLAAGAAGAASAAPGSTGSALMAGAGHASGPGAPEPPGAAASVPIAPASDTLSDVSCVSASFCMAVGGRVAEEWNGQAWRVVKATGADLGEVSCTRATFCMAIGGSPAEEWNGRTWRVVKMTGSGLSSLSCASASFCLAVGTGSGGESSVSQRWNGRSWRVLKTPDVGCVPSCGLTGVSCVSARNCWAVGFSADNSGATEVGVGLKWSGRAWDPHASTITPNFAFLSGVSCASAARCVAVGGYQTNGLGPCFSTTCILAVAWNGSKWRQLTTPMVGPSLSRVSCAGTGGCVAVQGTLAGSWDGRTWRQLTVVAPGESGTALSAVSCWRPSGCLAVGGYATAAGAQLTLAEEWDGRAWHVRRTPSPGDAANGLFAVSCRQARACMAVGSHISASDTQLTLAEEWDGRAWRVRATPSPGARVSVLSAVSCPAAARCVAVGSYDIAGAQRALAETWNGRTWRVRTAPSPGVASQLSGVWCSSAVSCVAVGSSLQASGQRLTLAEVWNGSTWLAQATPATGDSASELAGVWCASRVSCIAVGDDRASASPRRPLAEAWNGTAWRVLATPALSGPGELTAVACSRASTCLAVGDYRQRFGDGQPVGTLAAVWNGTTWRISATPAPARGHGGYLAAVSCPEPGRCVAAGGFTSLSGHPAALAAAWNGARWRRLSVPAPSPLFSDLNGISCRLASRCVAAGETAAQLTLAEAWDGSRWHRLKTANP